MDYESINKQISTSTMMVNSAFAFAIMFLVITLGLMMYTAYGIAKIKGQLKNQMVERRMVYKRERFDQQVESREGNYRMNHAIQVRREEIDRD